ncbi:MAG: DEAD/DEAH box helicase [Bacilli bacterium]|nr:DEAD/DEAH box helicase [Bacilli bacterium]
MLEDIKGIGLKTLHELNKLNINSLEDLLSYYPYRYNYYKPQKINETKNNETIVINGILDSNPRVFYFKKNLNKMTFNINTNSIIVKTEIFNRSFLKNNLKIGKEVSLIGKYNKKQNLFTASDIKLSPILRATMEPVYHLTKGIKKTNFNKLILEGLKTKDHIQNYIPNYLMNNYQFIDKLIAVKNIHNPKDYNLFKSSKLLLTYEELFVFMLKINFLKLKNNEMIPSNIKSFEEKILRDKIDNLPFVLTKDQLEATNEIIKDLKSGKRMNRLLLGDVGTGKTIVAFLGLYINKLSNHQGILMAPTEILAIQHYENCLKFFSEKEMKIALLTSSTKTK